MLVGIQEEILRLNSLGLLNRLLKDKTTGRNILWATDAYQEHGKGYEKDREISVSKITDEHANVIKNRARKELEKQSDRTRSHAEVFTPLWVCRKMNDHIDEVWFGRPNVFSDAKGVPTEKVEFPEGKTWKEYVDSRRMEITCGEAPYLVSRYNVSTGECLGIEDHVGILDRKLRVVNENTRTKKDWMRWVIRAFESTYGYELQGDNVLIARLNLLLTFEEYLQRRWKRKPVRSEYQQIINIIVWNIWQMDGLTGMTPRATREYVQLLLPGYSEGTCYRQMDLFDDARTFDSETVPEQLPCQIFDWRSRCPLKFSALGKMKKKKFDFIIGNPPYQEESIGEKKADNSIYNFFMDAVYEIAPKVELITPARFLFNNGNTREKWNKKMLMDTHFKVLFFDAEASNVFHNVSFKGGIAIHYRDKDATFEPIRQFTPFEELNSILRKVTKKKEKSLTSIMCNQNKFNLKALYADYKELRSLISSNGREKRMTSGCLEFPCFREGDDPRSDEITILGIIRTEETEKTNRVYKYISEKYVETPHKNLYKYKVVVPANNGKGTLGEILSKPQPEGPRVGITQTFISIGAFDTPEEADHALKYIKSKFARVMLGILKVTQNGKREMWQNVPLQDFTKKSDIDWSKSVQKIDQQLYKKYGLNKKEIKFIEEKGQEME